MLNIANPLNSSNLSRSSQFGVSETLLAQQSVFKTMVLLVKSKWVPSTETFNLNSTSQPNNPDETESPTELTQLFKTCSPSSLNKKWRLKSSDRDWLENLLSLT